jgi:hypothetical protein
MTRNEAVLLAVALARNAGRSDEYDMLAAAIPGSRLVVYEDTGHDAVRTSDSRDSVAVASQGPKFPLHTRQGYRGSREVTRTVVGTIPGECRRLSVVYFRRRRRATRQDSAPATRSG